MKFGPMPVDDALGGVIAHAVRTEGVTLRKGAVVTAADVAALKEAGLSHVVVAMSEAGDLGEDEAARIVAEAAAGPFIRLEPPFTGRCNLFSEANGVLVIDAERVHEANRIDEAITVATLAPMRKVQLGEMVGTVKMIPFAVPEALARQAALALEGALRIAPFKARRVCAISTLLPGLKPSVVDKTLLALADRLKGLGGSAVIEDVRVEHDIEALARALEKAAADCDIVTVFGASAITDRRDVIPAAIERAGGQVSHLGMPVDPGNLLLLGTLGGAAVIGAPGCARSPRENGFDWVLQRLCAGLAVTPSDIQRMGVGGLLMEIVSRPQPRIAASPQRVDAVILAAGSSTRLGRNKLLEIVEGEAVVRRVARAALASRACEVIVVTGHERERVEAALDGLGVRFVHNEGHRHGMAGSLKAGIASVGAESAACLILLGDMPLVTAGILDTLMDRHALQPNAAAVVPVSSGRRANPALLARKMFGEVSSLGGDVGARALLEKAGDGVIEIEVADDSVLLDVDTEEALSSARARLKP
jgi:molybdenum cofactor cytidylyltransferase